LKYAFDICAAQSDSSVPIIIDVSFEEFGCMDKGDKGVTELAHAGTTNAFADLPVAGIDPTRYYPSALANSLVGHDLDRDATFQSRLGHDVAATCCSLALRAASA
jgi:hypothetical protein